MKPMMQLSDKDFKNINTLLKALRREYAAIKPMASVHLEAKEIRFANKTEQSAIDQRIGQVVKICLNRKDYKANLQQLETTEQSVFNPLFQKIEQSIMKPTLRSGEVSTVQKMIKKTRCLTYSKRPVVRHSSKS